MDPNVNQWLDFVFRWIHVAAGVLWIGHLWFFNFVNAQVAKTYDADSKKKVVPQLMPRALYWFRWGAAYTWISGVLLLGFAIYMGGVTATSRLGNWGAASAGLGALVVGFFLYDILWKTPLAKNEKAGAAVSFVLLAAAAFGLGFIFPARAVFIHIGSILGTIMAGNVWMRIWPSQRKIVAAIRDGKAPDAAVVALAGLRSKHNTYMSVPLMIFMVSSHFPLAYGLSAGEMRLDWLAATVVVALGWGVAKLMFLKSAQAAPTTF